MEIIILQRFKVSLVRFLDQLIEWMPEERDLIATRILVNDQVPIEEVMIKFVNNLFVHKDSILNKDERFFFVNEVRIFQSVKDQRHVNILKTLWTSSLFTKEDKEKVWSWLILFIKLTGAYIKNKETECK